MLTREPPASDGVGTKVLLRAAGLRKSFDGHVVLDGADLELRQGEVVLLRGENGSGKTTLLNILTGVLEPDAGEICYSADDTPRTYRFPRAPWTNLNPWDHFRPEFVAAEGVGRTWQDVRLFNSLSLRDNIAFSHGGHPGENPIAACLRTRAARDFEATARTKAIALLGRLGLAATAESSADKISLGQSKRVAIARSVAAGGRVLFLDEPLAGLDRHGINDVLGLLNDLVREYGVTLVIVEHILNQHHFDELITTNWLLKTGRINQVARPTHAGTGAHFVSASEATPAATRPRWLELLQEQLPVVEEETLPSGALLMRLRRVATPARQVPLLELRNLVVRRGSRTVIGADRTAGAQGLNLTIFESETVLLHAPNGWGKSTLIDAIAGLLDVVDGEILLRGVPIHDLPTWDRVGLGLAVMRANSHDFPALRARDVLSLARSSLSLDSIARFAERTSSSLSGGERQFLAFVAQMRLGAGRAVRLLDEPFSALDTSATQQVVELLTQETSGAMLIAMPSSAL